MKVDMKMVEVSTEEDVPTIQDTDILFPFSWAYRPVTSCGIATTAPRSWPTPHGFVHLVWFRLVASVDAS